MDAGEEWRAKAGPWARAVFPDGQGLDVIVTGRYRSKDGRWWYECEAILPARREAADGTTTTTGAPTAISVHADDITPIPDEDYSGLPTDGAVAGRQWVLEKLHQYSEEHPNRRLHRRDCWQARSSHTRITTAEAAEMLEAPLVDICDVCRPDRALRRLCRATLVLAPAASPVGGGHFTPRRCRRPHVPLNHLSDLLRGLRSCSERPPRLPGGAAARQAASGSPPRCASTHAASSRPYSTRSSGHSGRPSRCRMNTRIASFAAAAGAASGDWGISGMRTRLRPDCDNQPCPAALETNDPRPGSV